MTPTMYMRFVERTEIIDHNPETNSSTGRKVKVLQQFWETSSGNEVAGDMFVQVYGRWVDVPLVKGD